MSALYPVMLDLEGRTCVIVGGGEVAVRKAEHLLAAGARLTIISPQLHPNLIRLVETGQITVQNNLYTPGTLAALKPLLVFAATDNNKINQQIVNEARSLGALVNAADEQGERDFINMAVVQRGDITISLSTGGAAPALLSHLQERVGQMVGEEYSTLVDWMAQVRPIVQAEIASQPARAALWRQMMESSVLDMLRQGDINAARQQFDDIIQQAIANQP